MPNYRILRRYEIDEREDLIAQVVAEGANSIFHIQLPARSFIEETCGAGMKLTEPIIGKSNSVLVASAPRYWHRQPEGSPTLSIIARFASGQNDKGQFSTQMAYLRLQLVW